MPKPCIQCLLFIAHKEPIPSALKPGPPPPVQRTDIVVYALLPSERDYGYIKDIFTFIGINLIRDAQFDPFLVEAVKSDRVEMIEMLIDKELADSRDHLFVSVEQFNGAIIQQIFLGYRIETLCTLWKHTALSQTDYVINVASQCWTIIEQLVSHKVDIRYRNEDGGTFLYFAVKNSEVWLVPLLLDKGAQANAKIHSSLSPLHIAAKHRAPVSILRLLIQRGADVNATISSPEGAGATPLILALSYFSRHYPPKPVLVQQLLESGADVNVECSLGNVLQLAVEKDSEVLACVLSHMSNFNTPKNQAVFKSALQNSKTESQMTNVRLLVDHGFRLCPDDAKSISLFSAAIRVDSPVLIEDLLKWGAGVYHPEDVVKDTLIQEMDRRVRIPLNRCYDSITFFLELEGPYWSQFFVPVLKRAFTLENTLIVANMFGYVDSHFFVTNFRNLQQLQTLYNGSNDELTYGMMVHVFVLMLGSELSVYDEPVRALERVKQRFGANLGTIEEDIMPKVGDFSKKIGDTTVTFCDILNASTPAIVRYLNDNRIVNVLSDRMSYEDLFPPFSSMILKRFRKAHYRKTLKEKGIKMFNFLSMHFRDLLEELKEIIIDNLSNIDLLVLTNVCSIPPEAGPN